MEDTTRASNLNLSLENHLVDILRTLFPALPAELAANLRPYLSSPPPATIPYSLLLSLSRWSRGDGADSLRSRTPPLEPSAYSMVALLAGTKTSPERNFGSYAPPKDAHQLGLEKKAERKAITALLNSILSILGSGFAAWWAADKTGWKNEFKVLLGLMVAIIVAAAEAVLYLIWQYSRQSQPTTTRPKRRPKSSASHKRDDGPEQPVPEQASTSAKTNNRDKGLRRRQ